MEKTIVIDGKSIPFKATAATPLRFKAQFGKDFFAEVFKLNKFNKDEFENLDFELFYNLIWTMAKTADPKLPDPLTWFDSFEEFPLMEIIPDIQDLLIFSIQGKKK